MEEKKPSGLIVGRIYDQDTRNGRLHPHSRHRIGEPNIVQVRAVSSTDVVRESVAREDHPKVEVKVQPQVTRPPEPAADEPKAEKSAVVEEPKAEKPVPEVDGKGRERGGLRKPADGPRSDPE